MPHAGVPDDARVAGNGTDVPMWALIRGQEPVDLIEPRSGTHTRRCCRAIWAKGAGMVVEIVCSGDRHLMLPDTLILTERGLVQARGVRGGDVLLPLASAVVRVANLYVWARFLQLSGVRDALCLVDGVLMGIGANQGNTHGTENLPRDPREDAAAGNRRSADAGDSGPARA